VSTGTGMNSQPRRRLCLSWGSMATDFASSSLGLAEDDLDGACEVYDWGWRWSTWASSAQIAVVALWKRFSVEVSD
jgi:hypothetical protein